MAAEIPVADDLTAEADSGGHTDNQPLASLFPVIQSVRDETVAGFEVAPTIRLGAAGSLGTPTAVAGAFALGAAFCREQRLLFLVSIQLFLVFFEHRAQSFFVLPGFRLEGLLGLLEGRHGGDETLVVGIADLEGRDLGLGIGAQCREHEQAEGRDRQHSL